MARLYEELAEWWPLFSPPSHYAEEAAFVATHLRGAVSGPCLTLLELGCGGGNNASHLSAEFRLTLTDLSPAMVRVSQRLNPEAEHHVGDMRSLRLGRQFDAVLVHDAVCYMTTREDLRQAIETAWLHCRPGGAVYFFPDFLQENFAPGTEDGGEDAPDGRGLRYLAWTHDPDPADSTYVSDYAFLLRLPDGSVEAHYERHTEGLFSRQEWLTLLHEAGFQARAIPFTHSEVELDSLEHFLAAKPLSSP
jgi:SAM-dependent methyltransferase